MIKYLFCISLVLICAQSRGCEKKSAIWVDFPKEKLSFHLGFKDTCFEIVDQQIKEYHQLNKSSIEMLERRTESLNKITKSLQQLELISEMKEYAKTLHNLSVVAQNKILYLEALKKIYDQNLDHYDVMKRSYAETISVNEMLMVLPLINKIIYEPKLPSYWGLYWLEALDPCHRMLTSYYVKWKEEKAENSFFLWLENQEIPYSTVQIDFFDDEKIKNSTFRFSSKDNLIYGSDGEKANFHKEDEEYLYVITLDKRILITKGNQSVRHLSLTRGSPVLAAGAIKILDGNITYLDGESGHYQPTIFYIKQSIVVLRDLGANLKGNLRIKYYHEKKVYEMTLNELDILGYKNHPKLIPDILKWYDSDFNLGRK